MTLARLRAAETTPRWTALDTARLEEGLRKLGVTATRAQTVRLQAYGELLLKWNRTYNLLGATSGPGLIDDHLLDSVAIVEPLVRWLGSSPATLIDVGSGAGLPGIVLAIMLEQLKVIPVEPNGKKAAFLRQAAAHCKLATIEVAECRLEDLRPAAFGIGQATPPRHFICRAFTSLARYATLCRPLMDNGSLLFAMKAVRATEEIAELESWVEVLAVEQVPAVARDVQRNIVVLRSKACGTHSFNSAGPQDGSASGGSLGNHPDDR
jgi:16S rRNA (guanine527-N7)-methyltransferase